MSDKAILVTAKMKGHYGGAQRKPGTVFTLTDPKHFSERWMVKGDHAGQMGTSGLRPDKVKARAKAERELAEGTPAALEHALQDVAERDKRIAELEAQVASLTPVPAPDEPEAGEPEAEAKKTPEAKGADGGPGKPVSRRRVTREG